MTVNNGFDLSSTVRVPEVERTPVTWKAECDSEGWGKRVLRLTEVYTNFLIPLYFVSRYFVWQHM